MAETILTKHFPTKLKLWSEQMKGTKEIAIPQMRLAPKASQSTQTPVLLFMAEMNTFTA